MFSKFQILKRALKRAKILKNLKKTAKKQTSNFFCLGAFTGGEKISLIKFAYFIQPFEKSY